MSSLFYGDWQTRLVRWSLALTAMLACTTASAQDAIEDGAMSAALQGRAYTGTTPLRLEHQTQGYGIDASFTAVGGRLAAADMSDAVGFVDGQFRISNESRAGVDVGLGYRWYNESVITGTTRILGVSGWYDGQETINDNYFNQLGVSLESLGEFIDLRLNANIPLDDVKLGDQVIMTDEFNYFDNFIGIQTLTPTDTPLRVVDFEGAARVFDLNIWVYGGGYQMDGEGISETGAKGGVRGYITNDLLVGVTVTDDQVFGTNTIAQVIWTPGRVGAGPTSWVHSLADRMREHVYRNAYVATAQSFTEGSDVLTGADGEAIRIVHVNSGAGAEGTGTGTFEDPITSLDQIDDVSMAGDIILVRAGTTYSGQTATLIEEQRFLGEGGDNTHTLVTMERGTITLPETFAGATSAARPTIMNGAAQDSVVLAGTTDDNTGFDAIEVSNFDFDGGENAIASGANGVGNVNINRLLIENTADDAIALTALTEELANGSDRVRFTPTINQVDFVDVGGDDIELTSVTEPAANAITETITITNIDSEGGNGVGVNLQNTRRTATLSNIMWDGNATGDGAILVQNAGTQAAVTLNGTNAFREGQNTSTDDSGYGIQLLNSNGTMTVTGTTITNTGGDSVIVNDGDIDLTFTGQIVQDNTSTAVATTSVVSVLGGHTGTLTFRELTSGEGVISATEGDGLQFDDADGTYTFVHEVVLDGTVNAVNVVGDSTGAITLQNALFTDTTGETIHFEGGDANMTLTGRITQANNVAVLNVEMGHTGTLTFNELTTDDGVISATNGRGLVFDDADGAYVFNDEVVLNGTTAGADTGIAVLADSEGTFTFLNADIDYNSALGDGTAVTIDGSDVQAFTLSGTIDIGATNNGSPIAITNNTGGSITINADIASDDEGVLVDNNTDTTVNFAGDIDLNTAANAAVTVTANTGGSVTFNVLDIDTTDGDAITSTGNTNMSLIFNEQTTINVTGTGDGVLLTNHTGTGNVRFDALDVTTNSGSAFSATNVDNLSVLGTDNTLATDSGVALNLNDVQVAGAGITFASVDVANGGTNAIVLNDVRGGAVNIGATGANPGDGGTIATTGVAVAITNAANVSLNNMSISSESAQAVDYVVNSGASRLLLNNNDIDSTDAAALESVRMNVSGSASTVNITLRANNITNVSDDEAVLLTTSGATLKTVNLLVENNENIENNSANAATPAASFQVGGSTTLNATVRGNLFTNTGGATGRPFEMAALDAGSTVHLDLNSNTGVGAGDDFYLVEQAGGAAFFVQELADTAANTRNTGTVNFNPNQAAFTEEPGTIPTP